MKTTLIANATILNEGKEQKGSVLIEGDRISEIYSENECPAHDADEIIDATDMLLLPGVIDDHVHFRDPGLTHKADMESESRAAAAGGVTTVFDMPNTKPQTTTLEALADKFRHAAECCHVNHSFFFGATNDNTDLLPQIDKNHVCGVKLFMGSSTGNMLVDKKDALRRVFEKSPVIIMTHCEDSDIISRNTVEVRSKYGDDAAISLHPQIRSVEACMKSTSLAVQLARETGARLHVAHITTAEELTLFSNSTLDNKRITAEVCPAHLLFCDEDYQTIGSLIKCNPAVKSKSDREALRKALTEGIIDVIGTDHAPHTLEEKQGGCLKAMSGMPMIQFSLVSMLQLSEEGVIDKNTIVEKMCHAPARLFNIKERGYIRKGYYADLTLVKHEPWTLTTDIIESKCKWSPLEGRHFDWKVMRTFCNGQSVYANGKVDRSIIGKPVEFDR